MDIALTKYNHFPLEAYKNLSILAPGLRAVLATHRHGLATDEWNGIYEWLAQVWMYHMSSKNPNPGR